MKDPSNKRCSEVALKGWFPSNPFCNIYKNEVDAMGGNSQSSTKKRSASSTKLESDESQIKKVDEAENLSGYYNRLLNQIIQGTEDPDG